MPAADQVIDLTQEDLMTVWQDLVSQVALRFDGTYPPVIQHGNGK